MPVSMKSLTRLSLLLFVGVSIGGSIVFAASLKDGDGSSDKLAATAADQLEQSVSNSHGKLEESPDSSSTASERLMRELAKIQKSAIYKKGHYTVELVGDDLYEWRVNVSTALLDKDCDLFKDLTRLRKEAKRDTVELRFSYSADYPFAPLFVRIIRPILTGRYLMGGGSICFELLSPRGWSSCYIAETLIIQIAHTLSAGNVRIVPANDWQIARRQNLEAAKTGFLNALRIHEDEWKRPPPKDD